MAEQVPEPPQTGAEQDSATQHAQRRQFSHGLAHPADLLLVFFGGAAGTAGRAALSLVIPSLGAFPLAIFGINILGAFLLGLLYESLSRGADGRARARRIRLLIGTGFMGGFTTYSTFALDGALLLGAAATGTAVIYLVGTILAGAAASWAGIALGARR